MARINMSVNYLAKLAAAGAILALIALLIPLAHAGPIDERKGQFILSIPQGASLSGPGWKMYFISVGQFNQDGWNFSAYKEQAFQGYLALKEECGGEGVFYNEVRELTPDERKSMTCTINGEMNYTHCNLTTTSIQACKPLIGYKIETDYKLDKVLLAFGSYYKSYLYDIGRADFYHHLEPLECSIEEGKCELDAYLRERISNPFVVALENTLTKGEIYFSDIIFISSFDELKDAAFPACPSLPCSGEFTLEQGILEISKSGKELNIEFGNYQKLPAEPNNGSSLASESLIDKGSRKAISVALLVLLALTVGIIVITSIFLSRKRD